VHGTGAERALVSMVLNDHNYERFLAAASERTPDPVTP
jgi:hypothetical protein